VAFERAWKIDRIGDVDVGRVVLLGVVLVSTLGVESGAISGDGRGFFLVEVWLDV
jgi:hypothetical protein